MSDRSRRVVVLLAGAVVAAIGLAGAAAQAGAPPLAGQWHFDSITASGDQSVTPDSSGNRLDARVVSVNQSLVAGRFGNALDLSRATAGVVQTSTSATAGSSPLALLEPARVTVAAWVKRLGSPGQYKYVVAKGARACAAASYALYTGASGGLTFYVDGGTDPLVSPDAGQAVWDGHWHMVAGVFDGTVARLYVDGAEVGSGTSGSGSRIAIDYGAADQRDFIFGSYPDGSCGDTRWGGQLDELRVYATALSSDDLRYLGTAPGSTPPTLPQQTPPATTTPAIVVSPAISGKPVAGQTVSCSSGTWTGAPTSFAYQWQLDAKALGGETKANHMIAAAEVGRALTCQVTATGAGGSTSATSAPVTPTSATGGTTHGPPPSAVLKPVNSSARAGSPVEFDAGKSDLKGAAARSYTYTFSNGATAPCPTGRPVISAVFDGSVAGKVALVVRTTAGASAAVSAAFSVGSKTAGGKTAVGRARLVSYACSATRGTTPQGHTSYGGTLRRTCLAPSTVYGGYVEMTGCISEVRVTELSAGDRKAIPFKVGPVQVVRRGTVGDPTADVFYAAFGEVTINGLVVTPAKGQAIVLAAAGGPGNTELAAANGYYLASGGATVGVYAKGARSLPLASGPMRWDVSSGAGPNGEPPLNNVAAIPIGNVTLATAAPVALPGIGWLLGKVISAIPGGNAAVASLAFAHPPDPSDPTGKTGLYVTNVPVDLQNLPFGIADNTRSGATAAVMLQSDNADGLQVGEFTVNIPDAFFGSVELKDISLTYSRTGTASLSSDCQAEKVGGKTVADALTGCAQTDIASGTISGKVVFGRVGNGTALKMHIDFQGNLQVVPDIVYMTKFSGDLDTLAGTLVVNSHLSILGGAVANGCGVAGAFGRMTIKSDPFDLTANGDAEVLCVQAPVAGPGSFFHLDGHGYFSEGAYIDYDLGDVGSLKGSVAGEGYFAPSDGQYHLRLDGDLALAGKLTGNALGLGDLTAKAHAVISDVGMAACSSIDTPWHTYNVGFGARYSPSDIFRYPGGALKYLADNFDFKADGCDTNDYSRIPAVSVDRTLSGTRAAPSYGFTVPAGQKVTIVLLHGQNTAPGAILRGPDGQMLDVSKPGPQAALKALVVRLAEAKETEVQIVGAQPGRWTVSPATSAPAIAAVDVSSDLGKPAVTARVRGRGPSRTLRYSLRNLPAGTKVAFVENGLRGGALLGRATGANGALRFTPSAARAGMRTIVAQLTAQDGTPRASITVARYSASPPAPGRASRLRVLHAGTNLRITFRPAPRATKQVVSVRLSDGRGLAFVTGGRARSVTVRAVTRKVHATSIVVRGSANGVAGPALKGHGG